MENNRDDFVIAIRSALLKKNTQQRFSILSLILFSIIFLILGSYNFKIIDFTKSIIKDVVYTSKEHSILNGITRRAVIEICKINKLKVKKGDYKIKHILNSECVFVTGTAAEIQFVKRINNSKFDKNNEIFQKLKKAYEELKENPPIKVKEIRKVIK